MITMKFNLNILFNPTLGLLPLLTFAIANLFMSYSEALVWGGIVYVFLFFIFNCLNKGGVGIYILQISAIGLLIYLIDSFLPFKAIYITYSTLFCEITLFLCFVVFNLNKTRIKKHYVEKAKDKQITAVRLNELFYISKICQMVINVHLFITFLYLLFPAEYHSKNLDKFMYDLMFPICIVMIILYEYARLILIKKELSREEWLPVVNETGKVIGKVARSVSLTSKNKFMHPVVRIALVYKGLIYLVERPQNYILDPGKYDYPFEKYSLFQHNLNEAVSNEIYKKTGARDIPVRFIFKYLFQNEQTNRLIYLYTVSVRDEETINKLNLKGGKMWTEKQIEENLDKGIFSECFIKEFEILKNTILMAEKYESKNNKENKEVMK